MRFDHLEINPAAVRRFPGAALLLTALAAAVYAWPSLAPLLQFDRTAVESGQWWRLVSCHWTHWSLDHLWWDAMVFALLGVICERSGRLRFVVCVLGSAVCISLAVWWQATNAVVYRGLSGVDSALFVLVLAAVAREQIAQRNRGYVGAIALLLLGFVAKLWYEVATGATVFVDSSASGFVPTPLAHAVGAAVGLMTALLTPDRRADRDAEQAATGRPRDVAVRRRRSRGLRHPRSSALLTTGP